MPRILIVAIASVAIGYLGICLLLFLLQRSMMYFPQPRALGASASSMTLKVPDAELVVTTRKSFGSGAVLYFGGNAEDVSLSLPDLEAAFPAHALYLLHYRGYGGSTGKPSEHAFHADALALFDKVHASHPDIVVVGRSLGSGVAIRLAAMRPVSRLVLVTPYDSMQELAARQFPWFPVRWLLMDKFESWRHAPHIVPQTTLIAAEHDEVIPVASSQRLHARFRQGVASLSVIPGVGHNTISQHPAYVAALRESEVTSGSS